MRTERWAFTGTVAQDRAVSAVIDYLAKRFEGYEGMPGRWVTSNLSSEELGFHGQYVPESNSIILSTDATRGTLFEELLHFRQAEILGHIG